MNLVKKHPLLTLMLALLSVSWCFAQQSNEVSDKGKSTNRTITGCLAQGDNAKEFQLTGEDGSTWEVRSDSVNLSDHVGHKVEVTGVVSHAKAHNLKEDTKDAAQDSGMKKDNMEHGHLQITNLQMVSDSCQ